MHAHLRRAMFALTVGFSVGCGGGSAPSDATASSTPTNAQPTGEATTTSGQPTATAASVALPVRPDSPAGDVVSAFLNAMRDGNSGIAAELLSEQARAETAKHQWPIQPPGAPSATYEIREAVYADASKNVVYVPCLWTEPDGAGGAVQFEVVWSLGKSPQGWRVAGFTTDVVPGKPPYFFNFENIANLKETQATAEAALAELAAQETAASEVANQPAATNQKTR